MTRIGIIGAMSEEVEIIKSRMDEINTVEIANMKIYTGDINNKSIVLALCGIGKVNAAVCTQILVSEFKVTHVINSGVAGGIADQLNIADMVVSTDVIEHDFDATSFGYEKGVIPRMEKSTFEADKELIDVAMEVAKDFDQFSTYKGRVVSGDVFVASKEMKEDLQNTFSASCAEMEGAAIGHTAYLNNIPFLILRSISDKADGTAHDNFNEFVQKAAEHSSEFVMSIIERI
ncbi:MAG: 5'-methylthioadenosine/adenosylhomocysteine nucleosidase [Firmicutes bacterium]|jgi:adenosylhomocysteine nucleosidase|nr:5'-methylthioadenosine/adenosylhomocysteine nucleosidase [Bacillota bacterium]